MSDISNKVVKQADFILTRKVWELILARLYSLQKIAVGIVQNYLILISNRDFNRQKYLGIDSLRMEKNFNKKVQKLLLDYRSISLSVCQSDINSPRNDDGAFNVTEMADEKLSITDRAGSFVNNQAENQHSNVTGQIEFANNNDETAQIGIDGKTLAAENLQFEQDMEDNEEEISPQISSERARVLFSDEILS